MNQFVLQSLPMKHEKKHEHRMQYRHRDVDIIMIWENDIIQCKLLIVITCKPILGWPSGWLWILEYAPLKVFGSIIPNLTLNGVPQVDGRIDPLEVVDS